MYFQIKKDFELERKDMDREINFYQYIKVLDNISSSCEIDEKLIKLFNVYISSNKNFKYNGTYLNDSIDGFNKMIDVYNYKKADAKNIMLQFNGEKILSEDTFVVVDHLFVIKNTILPLNIVDVLEGFITREKEQIHDVMEEYIKKCLVSEMKKINLFNMREDNIIIKYYNMYIDPQNPIYSVSVKSVLDIDLVEKIKEVDENVREI